MKFKRSSGILMHISSLPGKYGIGDLGTKAYQWVDFMHATGTGLWQVLPLNPTGYGDSPYQGLSAFAGNPLFIDLDNLKELGLLEAADLTDIPEFPLKVVDFQRVKSWKQAILEKAYARFKDQKKSKLVQDFEQFKQENTYWLEDFSLFMALREEYKLVSWSEWPDAYRLRDPQALLLCEEEHGREIEMHAFLQFLFFNQWFRLKEYANARGIQIVGDIPIFMGFDSADVWAFPHLFMLDKDRHPTFVAGVPPDFFSTTGQLWAIPFMNGGSIKKRATPGGSTAWRERSKPSTSSAWITSAVLPVITRSQPQPRQPRWANGSPAPAKISSMPSMRNWATCPSSPRTWA